VRLALFIIGVLVERAEETTCDKIINNTEQKLKRTMKNIQLYKLC
jgi:hypothetical protein